MMYRHIARQRLGKHIPAEAYSRNSREAVFCVVRAEGL
jgi:hypothetical protein